MKTTIKEKLIKRLIRQEANNLLGPIENAILDGDEIQIPSREEVQAAVYQQIIGCNYLETNMGIIPMKKEVRFWGKEALMVFINAELDRQENDGFKFSSKGD